MRTSRTIILAPRMMLAPLLTVVALKSKFQICCQCTRIILKRCIYYSLENVYDSACSDIPGARRMTTSGNRHRSHRCMCALGWQDRLVLLKYRTASIPSDFQDTNDSTNSHPQFNRMVATQSISMGRWTRYGDESTRNIPQDAGRISSESPFHHHHEKEGRLNG
jgi:hypothetical protein